MIDIKSAVDTLRDIAVQNGNGELIRLAEFLRQRIYHPDSYVVFLGESCSGKSTLINSIVELDILPVSSLPSTGTVTEVFLSPDVDTPVFSVINRDASMEPLDYDGFRRLALSPDAEVERIRAMLPSTRFDMAGVRIFDTPGYGSLIAEHDEVLEEFFPNSDSVIYTVGYSRGFQNSDRETLEKLKALCRPGTSFYLVVNRCPPTADAGDRKIQGIHNKVKALLATEELPLFIVPSLGAEGGSIRCDVLDGLRERIVSDLNSPARKDELYRAFLSYLRDLAALLRVNLEAQRGDAEELQQMRERTAKLSAKFRHAIDADIRPGFRHIRESLPAWLTDARAETEQKLCAEIDKQSFASKDEMIAYTNTHLITYYAREATDAVHEKLRDELVALDTKVDGYLNEAVMDFNHDITQHFRNSPSILDPVAGVAARMTENAISRGLLNYFAIYGGRGGAGAGVANAASHGLKKLGDLFGHTFSRGTHNTLKRILSKLHLTSEKALGALASSVIELATTVYDYAIWKRKLKKTVGRAFGDWEHEMLAPIIEDIDALERTNIDTISDIADRYDRAFAVSEQSADPEELAALFRKLEYVEEELANA